MSDKTKNILDKTNTILGILCAVMFIVAACRITYIAKIENFNDNRELVIENNEFKK